MNPEAGIAALRAAGFSIWPELVAFLERYEGIVVAVPGDGYEAIRIDPRAAAVSGPDAYEECVRHAGADLVPVGQSNNEHADVLLGRDGRLFGLFWPFFWSLGDSVTEAIVRSLIKAGEPAVNLEELYPTDRS